MWVCPALQRSWRQTQDDELDEVDYDSEANYQRNAGDSAVAVGFRTGSENAELAAM